VGKTWLYPVAVTEPEAPEVGRQCPWCAAPAAPEATRCSACGAALAQRESIAGVVIPGLTAVDPALEDYDKRPLHIGGPSPSQGMVPGLIVAAAAGGPIGLAALGGMAAVVAVEYAGAGRGGAGSTDLESVGKPSEVLMQALERLEDGTLEVDAAPTGSPAQGKGAPAEGAAPQEEPAADDGLSIWRDLPPVDRSFADVEADTTPES
jgi:hypothetical protein